MFFRKLIDVGGDIVRFRPDAINNYVHPRSLDGAGPRTVLKISNSLLGDGIYFGPSARQLIIKITHRLTFSFGHELAFAYPRINVGCNTNLFVPDA